MPAVLYAFSSYFNKMDESLKKNMTIQWIGRKIKLFKNEKQNTYIDPISVTGEEWILWKHCFNFVQTFDFGYF